MLQILAKPKFPRSFSGQTQAVHVLSGANPVSVADERL